MRVHSSFFHNLDPLNVTLQRLRDLATTLAQRSRVPFSNRPEGVVLLLDDGRTVPGVRLDSTSFPLTIPAATAAWCIAQVVAPQAAIVAAASSSEILAADGEPLHTDFGLDRVETLPWATVRPNTSLPHLSDWATPFLVGRVETPGEGVAMARTVAVRARVPASDFPVGCVGQLPDGRLVGGVNVEVDDWTRSLCAERTLVSLVAAYGLDTPTDLYLTCLKASCTPCGGCRQVLMDQFPAATIWMDRGEAAPERTSPPLLLPGAFVGEGL